MPRRGGLEYTPAQPEETPEETGAAYRKYFTDERSFYDLASRPLAEARDELFNTAREQMSDSARAIGTLTGQESHSIEDIQAQLVATVHQDLRKALAENDFTAFAAAAEAGEETSLRFAQAVEQNTGFVNLPGYGGPPDFPEGFGKTAANSGTAFLEEVRAILERIDPQREEIHLAEYRAAQAIVSAAEGDIQTARRTDWEDGDPYDLRKDRAEYSLAFRIESLRYLLQPETDALEHNDQQDDAAKRYEDAGLAVIDGYCTDDDLRTFLHSQRREMATGGDADAVWTTITEGLAKDRLDDKELAGFAQALGAYVNEARQELLQEWGLAQEYAYRDDLLADKMLRIKEDLSGVALQEIAGRFQWDLEQTPRNAAAAQDVSELAQQGRWAEVPGRLREMAQNQQGA